jgi:hypothetical protein
MTAHRNGGWIRHQQAGRGFKPSDTIVIKPPKVPAHDSWWTRPVSREEFDQLAAARWREAGWTGASLKDAD